MNFRRFIPASVKTKIRQFILRTASIAFTREHFAAHFIRGNGKEIGALQDPLWLPPEASARYVDRMGIEGLTEHYPELGHHKLLEPDIIDDGERLGTLENDSQDFVIANHLIEHMENPILALQNMLRVLKPGGILYLAIPDKRQTFDAERPSTSFEHLLRDYREGSQWSRRSHFEEWARYVMKIEEESSRVNAVQSLMAKNYSIHFHTWNADEMLAMLVEVKKVLSYRFETELVRQNGPEGIFILRKTG